jgi:hypothetical protein
MRNVVFFLILSIFLFFLFCSFSFALFLQLQGKTSEQQHSPGKTKFNWCTAQTLGARKKQR